MLTDADTGAPVVVVSYTLWRERLHSDLPAVGSTVKVVGELRTLIGIVPRAIDLLPRLSDVSGQVAGRSVLRLRRAVEVKE